MVEYASRTTSKLATSLEARKASCRHTSSYDTSCGRGRINERNNPWKKRVQNKMEVGPPDMKAFDTRGKDIYMQTDVPCPDQHHALQDKLDLANMAIWVVTKAEVRHTIAPTALSGSRYAIFVAHQLNRAQITGACIVDTALSALGESRIGSCQYIHKAT